MLHLLSKLGKTQNPTALSSSNEAVSQNHLGGLLSRYVPFQGIRLQSTLKNISTHARPTWGHIFRRTLTPDFGIGNLSRFSTVEACVRPRRLGVNVRTNGIQAEISEDAINARGTPAWLTCTVGAGSHCHLKNNDREAMAREMVDIISISLNAMRWLGCSPEEIKEIAISRAKLRMEGQSLSILDKYQKIYNI
ncbi:hypothetical protein KGD82_06245 [Nocardiopsis eucommiae]|uniref:Uncharacterized protein n=1 Tax=Nocardiopsis eucommiae TaxID=2831970 RepID=A0A975LAV3_9ACTN|nr:hypothetical protein KGD82_06245 [Nocardiopsis eucommiae]